MFVCVVTGVSHDDCGCQSSCKCCTAVGGVDPVSFLERLPYDWTACSYGRCTVMWHTAGASVTGTCADRTVHLPHLQRNFRRAYETYHLHAFAAMLQVKISHNT
jgi:hypothetical protein